VSVRIVSGGQTGADRGGLDAAIELGIPYGGWCPKGRKAEDGVIPAIYKLKETTSGDYWVRTEQNVMNADATVIFTRGPLDGGSLLTAKYAGVYLKVYLHVDLSAASHDQAVAMLVSWLKELGPGIALNVAGQRESKSPGLQAQVKAVLLDALRPQSGGLPA
jgi:hypothetical protein